jgi:broad specificity phosphatase PhoE
MKRLLLLRHGETVWNHEKRFTTRTDIGLSEVGVEQARRAAEALSEVTVDRIYTSPLLRAAQTAEIIVSRQVQPPRVVPEPRLVEVDAGPFEGQTQEELEASPLADDFARWHTDGDPEFPEGTESFDDALHRVSAFLSEHESDDGTTLIVTHGSLARLVIASYFLGGPPAFHRRLWLDNGRFAVFEWRSGIPKMVGFNTLEIGSSHMAPA